MYQRLIKETKGTPFNPFLGAFWKKRLILFVYIAARLAIFRIEQFAILEQAVFNLLVYEV